MLRFHKHRYLKRMDFSLLSSISKSILFPILLHKRYNADMIVGVHVIKCHCVFILFCYSSVQRDMNVNLRLHETYFCLESYLKLNSNRCKKYG